MKKLILVVLALTLVAIGQRISTTRYIHTTYLDDSQVVITCKNGADPSGRKLSQNVILVSCGDR